MSRHRRIEEFTGFTPDRDPSADLLISTTLQAGANPSGESKCPAMPYDERFEAMFRKALILPICTLSLLAASQFASAQNVQPASPCPPGTVAQNYNRGTESGGQTAQNYNRGTESGGQTAQNYNRGTETGGQTAQNYNRGTESAQVAQNYDHGTGGNAQVAQNFNRGTSAPVVGRPIDVADCR
jgi:hypothetical protein